MNDYDMELIVGVEPTTYLLQINCSAIEPYQQGRFDMRYLTRIFLSLLFYSGNSKPTKRIPGGPSWTRTKDHSVMSRTH